MITSLTSRYKFSVRSFTDALFINKAVVELVESNANLPFYSFSTEEDFGEISVTIEIGGNIALDEILALAKRFQNNVIDAAFEMADKAETSDKAEVHADAMVVLPSNH